MSENKLHISAGAFPYQIKDGQVYVLLIHKTGTNEWHLPKGTREKSEKIEDTAKREMLEETGFDVKLKRYLGWIEADFERKGKTILKKTHYFLSEIPESEKLDKTHDQEHDQIDWFPFDKAKKMIQDTNPVNEIKVFDLAKSYLPTKKGEEPMKSVTIIIEGGNFSGKSSIASALEGMMKNSTLITFHGYYRGELSGQENQTLANYFRERSESFLPVIDTHQTEEIIFQRLHLTDVVYTELYLGIQQDYSDFEAKLNERNVVLVLLDVNNETLLTRSKELQRGKSGHCDRADAILIDKRDRYRKAFNQSLVQKKLLIDTSQGDAAENARKIINWINHGE
ncbi:NUDIX domain-containing protein [Patescibacteria group bacterium]|nr:NUDIX domain-containing protein [Patescibacteria group bacterium]MBU2235735.1 NUDIX domain-containing protein [Patescibacteria group bacterium]